MSPLSSSPPRAPPIKYTAPHGTRWAKEMAAAGGVGAFDLPTDPKNIGPWILGECVGKGASGRVKIAKHQDTGQLAAVKILPIAPLISSRASLATQQAKSDKQRLGVDREITMMKLMNHPNILRIYDVFEGEKELFLVLEYVEGGELFDFLVNRGRLSPTEALAYFKQIIYGLNYAHTFSIIHRDLKPENILIASISPPLIKIADWGMAAFAPPSLQLETSCGSPHYASPEIVNGSKYQGNATDIWSCGVILYALLTGRLPFDDKNVRTLLGKVKSGKYDMPAWIDPFAKDLLGRMLVVDVNKRITIPEILAHPWICTTSVSPSPEQKSADLEIAQLPPSPSTLARPIDSPSLIDPELLSSLRVIWGRHTDPDGESIKRDLCSPIGYGVHAKAFYFLLRKYREDSLRNNYGISNTPQSQLQVKLDIGSMKFNLGWELDLTSVKKRYEGNRSSAISLGPPCSPVHSPALVPISGLELPSMSRERTATIENPSTRERANFPAGPRAPQPHTTGRTKVDLLQAQSHVLEDRTPKMSVNSPKITSGGIGQGGTRPPPPRRGYTYSHPDRNMSTVLFPQYLQAQDIVGQGRPRSAVGLPSSKCAQPQRSSMFVHPPDLPSTQIHTPSTTVPTITPTVDVSAPPSPKNGLKIGVTTNLDPKPSTGAGISNIERKVGGAHEIRTQPITGTKDILMRGPTTIHDHIVTSGAKNIESKENWRGAQDSWNYLGTEEQNVRGFGLGIGRNVGRNVGNITNFPDGVIGTKENKGKKPRPPTLDFRNFNQQKRSTMLGSPLTPSSPANNSPNNRPLISPVVGEFKGWFSNLFNWKNQNINHHQGILYSQHDVSRIRADVGRLLEELGIIVEGGGFDRGMSPADCAGTLKCRVEESNPSVLVNSTLRAVRFRVEFSLATGKRDHIGFSSQNQVSYLLSAANQGFLSPPETRSGGSSTQKVRNSILMNNHATPLALATPLLGGKPPRCESVMVMTYEKGSVSSFRIVWKRLNDVYGEGATAFPSCSPAIANTPVTEHPEWLTV